MKDYNEIGFQQVWENRAYLINGIMWYCYCAFPNRLNLTQGERHQETSIQADFDFHQDSDELREAARKGEDISKFGNLYKR